MKVHKIEAVSVNHNTSRYMERMLRSLFAQHHSEINLSLTVLDNASTDDMSELNAYVNSKGLSIEQTGFTTNTKHNSHGEILRKFVPHHRDCTHYRFLDADVCFLEENSIGVLLRELEEQDDAFGIGPRMSWDGAEEIPQEARKDNPDICDARLHPCCALVENTPLFRRIVKEVGLSSGMYL